MTRRRAARTPSRAAGPAMGRGAASPPGRAGLPAETRAQVSGHPTGPAGPRATGPADSCARTNGQATRRRQGAPADGEACAELGAGMGERPGDDACGRPDGDRPAASSPRSGSDPLGSDGEPEGLGTVSGRTGAGPGVPAPARLLASCAAPHATAPSGACSMRTPGPIASRINAVTSGIRAEPPVRTSTPGRSPAASSTRRSAATVSAMGRRKSASISPRCSRIRRVPDGSGKITSATPSVESVSFAVAHAASTRSRVRAPSRVRGSHRLSAPPRRVSRCSRTSSSSSTPPRCGTPSGGPTSSTPCASARRTAVSTAPPPKS